MKKTIRWGFWIVLMVFSLSSLKPINNKIEAINSEDIFFSEYIEGSSSNKALEIYNPKNEAVGLSGYVIENYHNGSTMPTTILLPNYNLNPGQVYVVCHSSAAAEILTKCNLQHGAIDFNGNDSLVLKNQGLTIDVIGQIGFNPGTAWGSGTVSTLDHTLVRKCNTIKGDDNGDDVFDPSFQWDGYPVNTYSYIGFHNLCLSTPTPTETSVPTQTPTATITPTLTPTTTISPYPTLTSTPTPTLTTTPVLTPTLALTPTASITPTWVPEPKSICGNEIVEEAEECDDGNSTNGDGCDSNCKAEIAGSISGFVYFDRNNNQIWDGWIKGEIKLNGWKVFIDRNNNNKYDTGEILVVTKGYNYLPEGKYKMDILKSGSYQVCEKIKFGWVSTLPGTTNCRKIVVSSGQNVNGINFGNKIRTNYYFLVGLGLGITEGSRSGQ